jgi:hypothetical protein
MIQGLAEPWFLQKCQTRSGVGDCLGPFLTLTRLMSNDVICSLEDVVQILPFMQSKSFSIRQLE